MHPATITSNSNVKVAFFKDYKKIVNVITNPKNTKEHKRSIMNYVELFRRKWQSKVEALSLCLEEIDELCKDYSDRLNIVN